MVFPHSGQRFSRRGTRIGGGRGGPPLTSRLARCVNLVGIGALGLRIVDQNARATHSATGVVEAGLHHSAENVYTEYHDKRRDEWQTKILPALRKLSVSILVEMSGLSGTTIKDTLAERSRPYPKNQQHLAQIVRKLRIV